MKIRRKSKATYIYLCLMSIILTQMFCNYLYAASTNLNFDDYVRDEERREIYGRQSEDMSIEAEKLLEKRTGALFAGRIISAFLFSCGICFILYTRNKYAAPHSMEAVLDFDGENVSEYMDKLSPIEISGVININKFAAKDLVMSVFDLIRRKLAYTVESNTFGNDKTRIYINRDRLSKSSEAIESYEDFLIGWIFRKIGNGEFFEIDILKRYLETDAHAAEFDIDYDVWIDELNDYIEKRGIIDASTEKWKVFCAYFGVSYAILGLLLLYATNSSISICLFAVTYISYKLSNNVTRRSKSAESDYQRIMCFKQYMDEEIERGFDIEEAEKWEKYMVYSIAFNNTEHYFAKHNKYKELYNELETVLREAIITTNNIVNRHSSASDFTR